MFDVPCQILSAEPQNYYFISFLIFLEKISFRFLTLVGWLLQMNLTDFVTLQANLSWLFGLELMSEPNYHTINPWPPIIHKPIKIQTGINKNTQKSLSLKN